MDYTNSEESQLSVEKCRFENVMGYALSISDGAKRLL